MNNEFIILLNHLLDMVKKLEKRIEELERTTPKQSLDGGKF